MDIFEDSKLKNCEVIPAISSEKPVSMSAMSYEFLMRRVNNCGRHGVPGADADVYRKMEHAQLHLNDPNWKKTQEQKEFDYRSALAEVRGHILKAIRTGAEKVKYRVNEDEQQELEEIQTTLHNFRFHNKEKLDEVIERADDIFTKYGLQPG